MLIILPIVGIVACGIVAIVATIVWFSSYKARRGCGCARRHDRVVAG
jgi:hypothetical protein